MSSTGMNGTFGQGIIDNVHDREEYYIECGKFKGKMTCRRDVVSRYGVPRIHFCNGRGHQINWDHPSLTVYVK